MCEVKQNRQKKVLNMNIGARTASIWEVIIEILRL